MPHLFMNDHPAAQDDSFILDDCQSSPLKLNHDESHSDSPADGTLIVTDANISDLGCEVLEHPQFYLSVLAELLSGYTELLL